MPKFTKEHYIHIARKINQMDKKYGMFDLIEFMGEIFQEDNPLFDEEEFREACEKGEVI